MAGLCNVVNRIYCLSVLPNTRTDPDKTVRSLCDRYTAGG